MVKEKQLRRAFPDLKLSVNRTYKELTSLGVGRGVIPFLAEVSDEAMLEKLLKYLHCRRTPFLLLGAGTNLVGSDTECYEMAIRLSGGGFSDFEIQNDLVICGAFAKLPLLTAAVAKAGLCGFAAISGIPGSVGGALRMNAGAGGVEIGSFVREVSGFYRDGRKWKASGREIEWVYRGNSIPHDVIITRAVFRLTPGSAEEEERAIAAELENRKKREPAGRSAGCAFRNVSDLEPAGMLIDRCGLRGLRVGDLLVSEKHANYLLNTGDASEADYIRMIQILRRAVSEKYGFYLRTEIVPVNPLTAEKIEKDTPSPRINLLYGGVSSEREISLQSGAAVCKALRNGGFKVDLTDIRRCAVTPLMSKCDVVYPVLHGGFGEGGELQKKLEDASLRFVGSGSTASALVMDKLKTKELLKEIGLPTAPWARVTKENSSFPEGLNFPVMIKAPCEGSTVGIVKVNSIEEWGSKLAEEFKFADELLVEEFIQGVEITVPVINATALEVIEIVPPNGGFYDWDAKYVYNNGQTEYLCPPRSLDEKTVSLAKEYALKFYHAARCRDILRVDFIVKDGVPYMLEGNSLPGNTDHSLVPKAARHGGISMEALTAKLVYAAMKRSGEPENRPENMETGFFSSRLTGILAKTARWFFRMTLILCGVLLIFAGVQMRHTGTAAIPLFAGGILLFLSEIMFSYFKLFGEKMKKILTWLLLLCVGVIIAAEPVVSQVVATGAVSPELPSPLWIDGKHHRISENRGKKFTVLFLFSLDQTGLSEIPVMINAVKNCDSRTTAFYGVGNGTVEKLQKFPGVNKLPFPVNSDHKHAAEKLFLREYDRLPMAVVLDKEGKVNWRGRTALVPGVIRQLTAGKFDLQEKIRAEKFSAEVTAAVRGNDFEKALKIIRKEWDERPANTELISLQLLLLSKHLKRPDEAFKVIAEAHKRKPHDPVVFDLEYRLINNTGKKELEKPFFDRVTAEFSANPMVLLRFAGSELRRSAKLCNMEAVRDMLSAAWTKGKFKNDEEKARFAVEYAKIMHNFGRPDLAKALALQASKLFKNQRERNGAMEAVIFYQKVQNIAPTLK